MTATDIANFSSAVGDLVDAMASFKNTVAFQATILGMQAANNERLARNESMAYDEKAFLDAAKDYGF